jgi:hypothetical protein
MLTDSFFVHSHPGVIFYNLFQVLNIIAGGRGESDSPMPYSKFATKTASGVNEQKGVPSKLGMLIIYFPSLIVSSICLFILPQHLAGYMCLAHFAKRNLETLFLHKYSGAVKLSVARLIGFIYALTTFMICAVSSTETDVVTSQIGQGK